VQIATNQSTTATTTTADARRQRLRKQREPYEVTLIDPNDKTKTIANLSGTEITRRCQDIINTETEDKPKLNGIVKTANGIRLNCETPEDAKLIRTLNFAKFDGLQHHTRNYGVVKVIYHMHCDFALCIAYRIH
jgi:hypothetical protein